MPTVTLPGFVDAHSHGFQRALRGKEAGGDFWAWREAMLEEAVRQTPETVRSSYADVYTELREAGYTAVGEFNYLGYDAGLAAIRAAEDTGIELVLVHAAYARGGLPSFRQPSVGAYLAEVEELAASALVCVAPHSVRACPRYWLEEIGRYAERNELPLHVHASEQPREVEECLAEHGRRPIELLADTGCLGPRTTVVHATHATDTELDLIAQAEARVCVCPTTEANLGDGFAPVGRMRERGIALCIGSDSNVRIDPLEELRELDGIARREARRRDVLELDELLAFGTAEGAAALGLDTWREVEADLDHPSLRGVAREDVLGALVHGCSAEVLSPSRSGKPS
jgi:formimidoylglutamate deiminase